MATDESGGTTPRWPSEEDSEASEAQSYPTKTTPVGWVDRTYERAKSRLKCPTCGADTRASFKLDMRDVEGVPYPYYTCSFCYTQFTRKPQYETIWDRKGRI